MKQKLCFALQLPPPLNGAAEVNQSLIKSEIINQFYDIKYFNISTSRQASDVGKIEPLKFLKTVSVFIKAFTLFRNNIKNVLYITMSPVGPGFIKDSVIILLAKFFRMRVIVHFHGGGIRKVENKFLVWYYKFVLTNTYVILLSKLLQSDIKSVYYGDVFALKNGIKNFEICAETTSILSKLQSKKLVITFLSNLKKQKGVSVFLNTILLLKESELDFVFNIAGQEGDIQYSEINLFIDSNGLRDRLNHLGPVYNKEKETLLRNSHILVHPTFNDAYPLILLEAMQAKCLVLSTDIGAISEIVDDKVTGFILENKALVFHNKIMELNCNRDLLHKMILNGYQKYLTAYTLLNFENSFVKVIQQILNSNETTYTKF